MRVAIVHDWLTGMRGGERCLEAFLRLYPNADVFTMVHIPGTTTEAIDRRVVKTSFLNLIPGIRKLYKLCLPLYPIAAGLFNFAGYDLVISLSHAAAKNVRVPQGVPHICYCFTPMRYIWDQASSYLGGIGYLAAFPLIALLRRWDSWGAKRVDHFVAISGFVSARIRAFYKRSSAIIPPPVRMADEISQALTSRERAYFDANPGRFFLCAGALVPYKRIDVAVEAFSVLKERLVVVGAGPDINKLRASAGKNVEFLGRVSDAFLWECYKRCRALVFPGTEDFGIIPVECLAAGSPVIGIDAGGLRESIVGFRPWQDSELVPSRHTGVFVPKEGSGSVEALTRAVKLFVQLEGGFKSETLQARARVFSYSEFFRAWGSFMDQVGLESFRPETDGSPASSAA